MSSKERPKQLYEFGPFSVDTGERVLRREGEPLALAPKLFETLLALVKHSGHIVEKSALMEAVWPDAFVEESNLAANVSLLRKMLGAREDGKPYIETVARRGYRFAAEVTELLDGGEDLHLLRRRTRTRIISTEEVEDAPATLFTAQGGEARERTFRTLAVLPFRTIGMERSEEYLGLGLADALITQLSSTGRIIVRPTSAVLRYTEAEKDSLEAGREMGADAVLEGSAQRADQRLRVTVRLLAVKDEAPLWAERFTTEMTDILAAQDAIAEQAATALALKLNAEERRRLTAHDTRDTGAYHAYLRGRYHLYRNDPDNSQKASAHFQAAIAADPTYAQAYAGLAESLTFLSILSLADSLPAAKEAAERAIELNDSLAEAHTALAVVKMLYDWDWVGCERAFKRAIELNPYYAASRSWYGIFLASMKRFDEALVEFARLLEIDPLSLPANAYFGFALYIARRYDQAIEQCLKTLDLDANFLPAMGFLGLSYALKGDWVSALQVMEKQRRVSDSPLILSQLAYGYAIAGRKSETRKLLAELLEREKTGYVSPTYIAMTCAALEDNDRAFEWMQKACDERATLLPGILNADPRLDALRADARYSELLRRVGLSA